MEVKLYTKSKDELTILVTLTAHKGNLFTSQMIIFCFSAATLSGLLPFSEFSPAPVLHRTQSLFPIFLVCLSLKSIFIYCSTPVMQAIPS